MGYRRRRKTITLKFAGKCADCGAVLPVGTTARWYGRGRVYGLTCHEDTRGEAITHDPMEEGAQLENRPSDDPNEAIFEVEVPGLGVKMRTGNGRIPQTKLFD
jgi:hypothetical protein